MGLRTILGLKKGNDQVYLNESYSQEGEDNILYRFFTGRGTGFFIDVGAHHPVRFSNTYKFYKLGWRGINIDAMPGSMDAFKLKRPADINLEVPISDIEGESTFYIFNDQALNTFSEELAKERDGKDNYRIERVVSIKTKRLDAILDQYLTPRQSIDFLSIDVEGYDYKILLSNNWDKYRPQVVLLESDEVFENILNSEIYKFMHEKGYEIMAKTVNTYFFKIKEY
jgi:FkbM family methyltransferase